MLITYYLGFKVAWTARGRMKYVQLLDVLVNVVISSIVRERVSSVFREVL